ncbi:uncharacterized mitochondrial protein AtMg00310-like [Juglans regia]|uniref:Uncharacterized mitochondrial protein AtMg00310-like n=1 Tax=Juglans regia TaxID=51240 RepID=A0A6P9E7N1_JUGRE|nr:uncharacterized mitochondrial protein AtMg00310-like [Juglans regia]
MSNFWWGSQDKATKVQWKNWENLSLSKRDGGLGFRDLVSFNLALLAKQAWRLLTQETPIATRILKAVYYPNTSILQTQAGSRPSFAWKSICATIPIIKEGYIWQVGDGKSIKVWEDKWIKREGSCTVHSQRKIMSESAMVADLIDTNAGWWNVQLIKEIFMAAEV